MVISRWDFHGKTAGTVIRTKLITAVTAGMRTAREVIPWDSWGIMHWRTGAVNGIVTQLMGRYFGLDSRSSLICYWLANCEFIRLLLHLSHKLLWNCNRLLCSCAKKYIDVEICRTGRDREWHLREWDHESIRVQNSLIGTLVLEFSPSGRRCTHRLTHIYLDTVPPTDVVWNYVATDKLTTQDSDEFRTGAGVLADVIIHRTT